MNNVVVTTKYFGVSEEMLPIFAARVFDSTWAKNELSPEKLLKMKADFLDGKLVSAKTFNPENPEQSAETVWQLERKET